jgi:hypothetical protein
MPWGSDLAALSNAKAGALPLPPALLAPAFTAAVVEDIVAIFTPSLIRDETLETGGASDLGDSVAVDGAPEELAVLGVLEERPRPRPRPRAPAAKSGPNVVAAADVMLVALDIIDC